MSKGIFHSGCRAWLLAIAGACIAVSSFAEPVLESISEIKRLTAEESANQLPVCIEAQVIRAHPREVSFFVFAEDEGIYVSRIGDVINLEQQHIGDWVRIRGITSPGEFAPTIVAEEVEVIQAGQPLPQPRSFWMSDIHAPGSDCDWVTVNGRLTGMSVAGDDEYDLILLTLEIHESISLGVQMPYSKEAEAALSKLMFERVRVNAVIGSVFNSMRQLTGRVFLVNSFSDFQLLGDAEPEGELLNLPIHLLLNANMNHRRIIRTQGIVTYAASREIFLRGEKSSLKVAVQDGSELEVGQTVQLEGIVWPQPISPAFRARSVEVLDEKKTLPEPKALYLRELLGTGLASDLLDSKLNYELVRIQGQLVDVGKTFGSSPADAVESGQRMLLCRADAHLFEVRLPPDMEIDGHLKPGAILELTGICNLIENKRLFSRLYFDGLWLQARSADDIVVLQHAPWWTPKRLIWISVIALGIALLFLVWVAVLHKVVDKQTAVIGDKIERETILDERQRIARELHDNLEQGLTGTAIQLQGNRRLLQANLEKWLSSLKQFIGSAGAADEGLENQLKAHLDTVKNDAEQSLEGLETVQDMLSYCGEESRSSILDLRGGLLEKMDLVAALKAALNPLADECGACLKMEVDGTPRRLKQAAERNLLLVAKEAASNAARHSRPNNIEVNLVYSAKSLSLSVEDDGCGFLVDQLSNAGRFGLQGMHERINRLGGTIEINSTPGEGTSVRVMLAQTFEWELNQG